MVIPITDFMPSPFRLSRTNMLIAFILPLLLQSCSKGTAYKAIIPYADTTGMLTGSHWAVAHFWYDMNNNGHIDSGEVINGFDFLTVYSFSASGALRDSTAPYLSRTGTWSYSGGYKNAILCRWNATTSDLHYIISITDTTLTTKRWGTNETWYFVKY